MTPDFPKETGWLWVQRGNKHNALCFTPEMSRSGWPCLLKKHLLKKYSQRFLFKDKTERVKLNGLEETLDTISLW